MYALPEILAHIAPNCAWGCSKDENGVETFEWYEKEKPRPTKEDIERGAKELSALDYKRRRANEYPPLTEFADAYYHLVIGDQSHMDAYMAKCVEIKNKYPKPENAE